MKTYRRGSLIGFTPPQTSSLNTEFQRVKEAMERPVPDLTWEYLHAEPTKIAAGMEVLADGVDWDPGAIGVAGKYRRNEVNTAWELIEATGVLAALNAHLVDPADAHDASAISSIPAGNLASTDVQAALNELDGEKQAMLVSGTNLKTVNSTSLLGSGNVAVGTVTSASVASANGFAGTVATASSTPVITLTTTLTGLVKGNGTALSAASAGADYSAGTSALSTGILKSTTTTGALSIAVAADFPTLNQNTTGSAATLATARAIYGNNFDGSAALTAIIASTYGGTGNAFTKFSGPATAEKTFTLPNASATLLYEGGPIGGTTPAAGTFTTVTATGLIDASGAGAGQIKFPATRNASADANTLDDYQEGTFTGTATGMTTSPTGTFAYTIVGRAVTVTCPVISGTSNATTFTITGMPAEITPANAKSAVARVRDNGTFGFGLITFGAGGTITMIKDAAGSAWTNVGTKSLEACSVCYSLE